MRCSLACQRLPEVHVQSITAKSVTSRGVSQGWGALQVKELVQKDDIARVMCVGHNRGWEEAASGFCGQPVTLPTASAALMQVEADSWEDALKEGTKWTLVGVVTSSGADMK